MVADVPETGFATTTDGLHIGYQVEGSSPLTVIELTNGTLFSVDAVTEQPRWQAYVDRLASFSRLIDSIRGALDFPTLWDHPIPPLSSSGPATRWPSWMRKGLNGQCYWVFISVDWLPSSWPPPIPSESMPLSW